MRSCLVQDLTNSVKTSRTLTLSTLAVRCRLQHWQQTLAAYILSIEMQVFLFTVCVYKIWLPTHDCS
jgi:hypothetical protein